MYGEITKREIIASISIVAIMILIGVLISGKISEHQMDKNEIYNKAVKIESTDLFQYGMDTNVGNAFVYGDLEAVDTVTYPEIGGEYIYVKKVEQRYERHERIVTKEDSDGDTYTEVEVYYTWDTENTESKAANEIKFCGVVFPYSKIDLPYANHIKTIKGDKVYSWKSGEIVKVRFQYYGVSTKFTGTIFTDLRDHTISDNTNFHKDMNIEETVESLQFGGGQIIFWIFWIILTCACVFGFYYIDNRWLE
jgi:hypothetical protein